MGMCGFKIVISGFESDDLRVIPRGFPVILGQAKLLR